MTELGLDEEGRALLDLARDADGPSDQDRRRVRAALVARLGAAAGLGVGAGLGLSAKAAAAGTTLGTKLIVTALVVGAAVGGGATIVRSLKRASPPPVAHGSPTARRVPRPTTDVAARAMPKEVTSPTPKEITSPAQRRTGRRERLVAMASELAPRRVGRGERHGVAARPQGGPAAPAPSALAVEEPDRDVTTVVVSSAPVPQPPAPQQPSDPQPLPAAAGAAKPTLATEARLVHDAVAALRAGQSARALALCDAHGIFYPQGALAEECAAQRVLALADLGRVADAQAAGGAFLRAHPKSPLAAGLRKRLRALEPP